MASLVRVAARTADACKGAMTGRLYGQGKGGFMRVGVEVGVTFTDLVTMGGGVRARDGRFDIVVTPYHAQGQIAMKLLGFGRGVTVLGGLPVPVTTCGHGTAYDIAGQGIATAEALKNAFAICRELAISRLQRQKEIP